MNRTDKEAEEVGSLFNLPDVDLPFGLQLRVSTSRYSAFTLHPEKLPWSHIDMPDTVATVLPTHNTSQEIAQIPYFFTYTSPHSCHGVSGSSRGVDLGGSWLCGHFQQRSPAIGEDGSLGQGQGRPNWRAHQVSRETRKPVVHAVHAVYVVYV